MAGAPGGALEALRGAAMAAATQLRNTTLLETNASVNTLPLSYATPQAFVSANLLGDKQVCSPEVYALCRKYRTRNGFVRSVIEAEIRMLMDGFTVEGENADAAEIRRIQTNLWDEWLTCSNAVLVWLGGGESQMVVDTDMVKYQNVFGKETLKVKMPKTVDVGDGLGDRYANALRTGVELDWGGAEGEGFSVLTLQKLGKGLMEPSLFTAFRHISQEDLLRLADLNGAWRHKDIYRHYRRGHEIKNGNLAGQPTHFLKPKQAKKVKDQMAKLHGNSDIYTNFDTFLDYITFASEFFDAGKYEAVNEALLRWAGPIGRLLLLKDPGEQMWTMAESEGLFLRAEMKLFLEDAYRKMGKTIKVTWNPHTFQSQKMRLEFIRYSQGAALLSPQTARALLGYDNEIEGSNLLAASKQKEKYTPPFEAKQGLVAGPGRPENVA